jgi:pyruvate,water dikinase
VTPAPLIDAVDERQFGGKAASLARSLRAGLPVPPGFALSPGQVESIADEHPEALGPVRAAFTALAGPCAVRSSAIGEDSEHASFAGQHATVLNVRRAEQLGEAVRTVRDSGHTPSVLAYRRTLGLHDPPRVAVLVQRMIDPDCAGVMFTRNPVNGSNERVIEASWGLGEAVVAGLIVPDNYALDTEGRVLRRTAGEKDIALRTTADGGTIEEAVDGDRVDAFCLADDMLSRLHDLANRCESVFGSGLDIEWAFARGALYLLQCRPMTRSR